MAGYREITPDGPDAGLLECAWQSRHDRPHAQRVLPDGCMDLLRLDARPTVAGPDTAAHLATGPAGAVTTGLRFRPGILPGLLGVPADALRDARTPLEDLLPSPPSRAVLDTVRALADDPDTDDVPRLLLGVTRALRDAADDRRPLPDPLPRPALRALARGTPAAELADLLGIISRTLHRRCLATLGYGPSVARRVLRFRAASSLLFAGVPTAEVAARTGYADQPHLSREVRALAGVSPTTLTG
ncbi:MULTISPECIES: helix-turn-helix domain-containing protein [unclassified Pseudonocardia]|uniref:helix-turn-helix domain-containing protein n=1 Tax=unclassified Pseudonocardia TaxID=2619320 RepID=UPI000760BA4E|nr:MULTISPECIES: helix-turn-helix domain-containing protein [unclassified Pseudonocardia]